MEARGFPFGGFDVTTIGESRSVTSTNQHSERRWSRWLAFRLAAIAVGLSPFLIAEAALRLSGWRPDTPRVDPYVGFHATKPLFEPADDGRHLEIPPWRREFFEPERFLATKPPEEFRIFCLGGSTVQGRPYSIATSFTKWLELSLKSSVPRGRWKVVNCGGVSYASYRLVPIMEECLQYEPDMFIVYTGHNEYLEDRSYAGYKSPSPLLLAGHQAASHSKLYQWALSLGGNQSKPRSVLPTEVDALLDYRGGLETYHRDPIWRDQVVRHYGVNIRRMITLAAEAKVPLLLLNPVSNLRDTPPFKSEWDPTLPRERRRELAKRLKQAEQLAEEDRQAALRMVESLLQIDPEHPGAWFLKARCHLSLQQFDEAKVAFVKAKDFDVCPLRMTEPLHAELNAAAEETSTPLLDIRAHFEGEAEHGIVGDRQLIDHVHPRIEGHQAISRLLMESFAKLGWLQQTIDLEARRAAYRQHLRENVDEAYMARGQQRLEGLQRWAAGRAFKVKPQ